MPPVMLSELVVSIITINNAKDHRMQAVVLDVHCCSY